MLGDAIAAARRASCGSSVIPSSSHVSLQPSFSSCQQSHTASCFSSEDGNSVIREALDEREAAKLRNNPTVGASDELIRSKIEHLAHQEEEEGEHSHFVSSNWKVNWSFFTASREDGSWIHSSCANALFGSAIFINAIYLGLETDYHNVKDSDAVSGDALDQAWLPWFLAESAFLAVFTVELLLRVKAGRWRAFRDLWNIFDLILVSFGILDTWILQFVIRSSNGDLSFLTLLRVVRLVRLVRVLRILRLFRFVRELTLLAQGILSALLALGWSLLLILIVLYISAIFVTEVYGEDTGKTHPDIRQWFGSLGSSFLTLFQLMTLENWHQVVGTVMQQPGWGFSWLFFIPFIGLTNIVLLNVITGVVVERVLSCAANSAMSPEKVEMQQIHTMRELQRLFESMDPTHRGSVSKQQFSSSCEDPAVVQEFEQVGFLQHELDHLFSYLVAVPEESVRICDLVDGCLRIRGTAQSKHLLKVQFDILRVGRQSKEQLYDLNRQVLWVIRRLERMEKKRRESRRPQEPPRVSDERERRRPPPASQPPPVAQEAAAPAPASAAAALSEGAALATEPSQASEGAQPPPSPPPQPPPQTARRLTPPAHASPAQPPQSMRRPTPPAQAPPPLLDPYQHRASSPALLEVPGQQGTPQPEPEQQAPQPAPAERPSNAATWLHSKLADLKHEQAITSSLLEVFAGEMQELRATVLELKCPVPVKNSEDEDSQSNSGHSHTSSVNA